MRIAITGASGFIGQQLMPLLRIQGHEFLMIDHAELSQTQVADLPMSGEKGGRLRISGCDAVLHLAGLDSDATASADDIVRANVIELQRTINFCREFGIKRLIYPVTIYASASGSPYERSKAEALNLLNEATDLITVKLRRPIVYSTYYVGKLAVLNKTPKIIRGTLFKILASIKPTLHISSLAQSVSEALLAEKSYEVLLSDQQEKNWFYAGVRRVIDIGFALGILVFFWWLLLAVWFAVRVTSEGPVIFAQERVGRLGKVFTLYKFRTMARGTKQTASHEVPASAITSIGSFLRKTKIDELPQIWNILKDEISLIGPRPCLPAQIELVDERVVRGVLEIQPGITGYAQVRGVDMADPEKLARLDEEYMKLRTLPLDLKILLATFLGKGNGDRVRG